jgi:alkanesulfonate monooxygenase SsuD/methylene tetrahydromethanopterin reductase-like flavin-dependent oxidoreductase (luciferase family)
LFTLRFDMRAPAQGASTRDLYAAALDMAAWGEENGCVSVILSEHHASPDGYLPAPLVLASAMAARTRTLGIQVAALIVPLHDPIELAEQMSVLDITSGGRVSYVTAVGYRPEEFAMFGRELGGRGRRMDACLEAMKQAWTGEPFEFEGRKVRVTPTPLTPGGPVLFMGGNTPPAIRRAARFGMGVIAEGGDPSIVTLYAEECEKAGKTPGLCIAPPTGTVTSAFVAEDPERAWSELGPYLLHDATMYAAWMGSAHTSATKSSARDVAALRAEKGPYRIFTPDEAVDYVKSHGVLLLHPLCGGLPPELAWPSLELVAGKVLPALAGK